MKHYNKYKGFTLIEILIAVLLVGLAISALMAANGAFTMANGEGANLSTAEFLIEQIRELTTTLDYDDIYDLDDSLFSPPISAASAQLIDLSAYSQQVTVQNISQTNFEQVVDDGDSDFVRITVTVFLDTRQISSASWIRTNY